ncbi:Uncharacterised protein [uncultured archaeon]|nr:Uncharacterised protein [uncultured archaeon]
MKRFFTLTFSALVSLIVVLSAVPYSAYGDGFTMENLPPASVGNRNVQLFIKLTPPIITSDTSQPREIYLRVFDANTNQSIVHDSMFITITKHDQLLMRDLFHTHTGELTLDVTPTNTPGKWIIYGDQEPFLNAWVNQDGGPIPVLADALGEGGLYHIHIELFAIDYDNNIFTPDQAPKWDSYLSVGDISNHNVVYNSNTYNTTVISYYDKINDDFSFDPSKVQVSYSMPFDWNLTRIASQPIFVHEEIHIPKSFKDFTNTPTYTATVNGYQITGRRLIVDPYTLGDTVIAHILLNKLDIANMANQIPSGTNTMSFTLAPAKPNVVTSSSVLTDFGGWGVTLGWNPTQIAANSQNNLKLSFFDAFTQQPVNGDVNYDLKVLDSDGNIILSKTNLTAANAVDTQTLNLPGNGIYSVQINIKSIVGPTGLPDTSRIGMARGNLVIPSTVGADQGLIATQTGTSGQTGSTIQIKIPQWVKNNAGWWYHDQIDAPTFAQGIQYLIQQGIIKIPTTTQGQATLGVQIPSWVKNDAGWWSAGQIDDQTFVAGIQWLVTNGIITV